MCRTVLVLILLLVPYSVVHAGDGSSLIISCKSAVKLLSGDTGNERDHRGLNYCAGLVNGVMATMVINGNSPSDEARKFGICHPTDKGQFLSIDPSIRVVLKYLEEHPEKLHEADAVLAITALKGAFPCP
ncbi:hypothetical protein JWZ98_19150 [Methylomonas sp. EFPC1]|uniref:Rap1a/Tai family immunity protein n=1 Tax=Methylomonas sp. EFPC1 TaxID=2812647 RepID=UPI0019670C64|nr:Rap1a/Tai family immunity protein [Methylomonas sp. EFPC1]QSB00747.1 hypothetical protein JWZ98_19150 [Methylomonas sp. EFPC1]